MDYKLFATADNAEGQLDSGISAVSTTISLKAGEGALFPQTINGTATSGGDATNLNSTGIGASGVAVGDFIFNLTDGSHAYIVTVNTNDVVTTPLQGGTGNTWDNTDVWVVNSFVITLNKRDVTGTITQSEKVLIQQRVTDDLTVWTGGRGYDGSTPASFLPDDYVNLFVVSLSIEEAIKGLSEMAQDINTLDLTKVDTTTLTALLNGRNWKQSVICATTTNGTLASGFEDGDTIDGIVLSTGDRILIKDQTTLKENGIYTVNASGAPTRADDFNTAEEATSAVVAVETGTAQQDTIWLCTDDDPVIDTDPINFVQFGTTNVIANQAEAEAGTDNTKTMTPLRTKESIQYNRVFGGDASDGDLTVSSDTTLNPSYKVFNYKNLTIDTGFTLDFGANFQNKIIHIKVKEDCTINGTLSLKGAGTVGVKGGNGGSASVGSPGLDGADYPDILDSLDHFGGLGGGGGGGAGGTSGTAGNGLETGGIGSIYTTQDKRIIYVVPGASGASGGGGYGGQTGGGTGGNGGNIGALPAVGGDGADQNNGGAGGAGGGSGAGGGALILEIGGDFTIGASGVIDLSGQDGADGGEGGRAFITNHGGGGGGGGAGAGGGMGLLLYNGALSNSGSITVAGGDGGDGGNSGIGATGAGGEGGGGGGGGAGFYSGDGGSGGNGGYGGNGGAGNAGSGGGGGGGGGGEISARPGGNGGAGNSSSGLYVLEKNVSFG